MNIQDFIELYYMPVVAAICFGVGYVVKHWMPTDNKWVPTIGAILGAILGCLACHELSVEAVAKGIISGLSATGLYELVSEHIESHDLDAEFLYEEDYADETETDEIEEQARTVG